MKTQELLFKAYGLLKENGIESYILDSQLLLAKVLNCDRMAIITNRDTEVSEEAANVFFQLVEQRKKRKPLKYITNKAEFMGIELHVEEGVLIPRPDTEILVEVVLNEAEKRSYNSVCDVCCGSGAIGISLAKHNSSIKVQCCDISYKAEEVTRKNIELLRLQDRVEFYRSDLLEFALKMHKQYDIIVSNPPYIKASVVPTLMEDVKDYEPFIALCGGEDGLDFYRKITAQSKEVLRHRGILAYEIGYDQGQEVSELLIREGFKGIRVIKDLAGLDRVVIGIKS